MADETSPPADTDRISRQLGFVLSTTLEERIAQREDPKPQEVERVIKLTEDERYDIFLDRAAGNEEIWAAFYPEGILSIEMDGEWTVPFWPERRYVEFGVGDPSEFEIVPIPLDDWIDTVLCRDMRKDGTRPALFPVMNARCIVLDIDDLLKDLANEWRRFIKAHLKEGEDYEACIERLEREGFGAKPKGRLP